MPEKKDEKRRAPISYRPPKDREAELEQRVSESGLSVNAFITEAIFGRTRHRPAELRQLAAILGECARIRDQLHEINLSGDNRSHALILEAIHDLLTEIRAALFVLMGRRP